MRVNLHGNNVTNQVHCIGYTTSQYAETPSFAEKRGFTYPTAKFRNRKHISNLPPGSKELEVGVGERYL